MRCPERRRVNGAGVDSVQAGVFSFLRPTLAAGLWHVRLICFKGLALAGPHCATGDLSPLTHSA